MSTQSVERVQESRQSIDCDIAGAKHHCGHCIQESRQSIDCDIAGAGHHCCQRRVLNVFKRRGRASTVSSQVQSKHHCGHCIQESRQSIDCDIAGAEHHCCQRRALNVFKSRGGASTVASRCRRLQRSGKEGVLVSLVLVLTLFLCSYFLALQ